MINYSTIYDDVYDITSVLIPGIPLIRDFQSDLKPAERYAAYRIVKFEPLGFKQTYSTDIDGTYKIVQTYSLTMRFSVVGVDTAGMAAAWHMRMMRPTVIDSFESSGLHLYDRTDVRDVPRFVSTGYEDRSLFDLSFYLRVEDEDSPGWIEFVQLTEKITKENNTVAVEQTTTIDLTP